MTSSHPVIVCVNDDPEVLADLERELVTRYGTDYALHSVSRGESAIELVESLLADGRELALVMADEELSDPSGIDVLARAGALSPGSRRGLLVRAGERPVQPSVLRAATLGAIHCWIVKPTAAGLIEEFHHTITDALYGWSSVNRPFEWVRLVGSAGSRRTHEIRDMLSRNRVPFGFHDVTTEDGRRLLDEVGATDDQLPVLAIGDGEVLVQPSMSTLATALGGDVRPRSARYDVVVVGAGPAGLAAAISAASEGLGTLVVEREAIGGQAGTSSSIRNYLGFPLGISGADLALRAFHQALLFGVEFVFANEVIEVGCDGSEVAVTLSAGEQVRARSVVIAAGVHYRRLGVPELERRIGSGVFYGAGTPEAQAMAGKRVCVVGAGNSAGQAAVLLAQHAERVTVLVRGSSLAETMSDYLVRDLRRMTNIVVRFDVEVVGGTGAPTLQAITLRDVGTGGEEVVETSGLFVLIGAEPAIDWLPPAITRDRWGYILTGADVESVHGGTDVPSTPAPFETAVPRVFAVGDIRHGSQKRVAAAVGEGSTCIRMLHERVLPLTR